MTSTLAPPSWTDPVGRVEVELLAEFADWLPATVIRRIVDRARLDLGGDVPSESLAEFVHRSARVRLLTLAPGAAFRCTKQNLVGG